MPWILAMKKVLTSMWGDFVGRTPVFVHVKDERIVRIGPIIFSEDESKPWSIKVGIGFFSLRFK